MSIVKTPGTCGGSARIDNTRIGVWLIYRWMQMNSDATILDWYPTLKQSDLDDVRKWIEVPENFADIERDIQEQHDAFNE
jgi:uncharacterized protein (DUF433 family)